MQKYVYRGPVKEFDYIISNYWEATTYAASESKARSNLAYRYKREHQKVASTKITLPGEIELIN